MMESIERTFDPTLDESGLGVAVAITQSSLASPSMKSNGSSPTLISTESDATSVAGMWSVDSSVDLNYDDEHHRRQRAVSVDTSLGTLDRSSAASLSHNNPLFHQYNSKRDNARRNFAGLAVNRFNELTEYMFMCTSTATTSNATFPSRHVLRSPTAVSTATGNRPEHVAYDDSAAAAIIESTSMDCSQVEAGMEIGEEDLLRPAYDLYRV